MVGFSDTWKQILGEILEQIAAKGPEMIKAAGDLILDFLDGIEQNSDEVAAASVELVIAFSGRDAQGYGQAGRCGIGLSG